MTNTHLGRGNRAMRRLGAGSKRGISEPRRTTVQVGAHRLDLVGAPDQHALFMGFRRERGKRTGGDIRSILKSVRNSRFRRPDIRHAT